MPDLRKYWQEIRAIESTLPTWVWLMSLDDPRRGQKGGSMAEAPAHAAAKLIHAKSHRLATEDEITAHKSNQQETARLAFEERLTLQGISRVPISGGPSRNPRPPRQAAPRSSGVR